MVVPPGSTTPDGRVLAVALDGLAGVGKSTVARQVAASIGWAYLDTGATYRAVTLAALESGVLAPGIAAVADEDVAPVLAAAAEALDQLQVSTDPAAPGVRLAGRDRSADLRTASVTATVSAVSAISAVRSLLRDWQRAVVIAGHGCVCEGRDIGTAVLPDALLKVWLTADPAARVARRLRDREVAGADVDAVRAAVQRRDALDSARTTDPARPAADAVVVDTSAMAVDAVVAQVLELLDERRVTAAAVR